MPSGLLRRRRRRSAVPSVGGVAHYSSSCIGVLIFGEDGVGVGGFIIRHSSQDDQSVPF